MAPSRLQPHISSILDQIGQEWLLFEALPSDFILGRANRIALTGCMINPWRWRPRAMKRTERRNIKRRIAKAVLRLPDLEIAKSAVLNSLSCPDAQRGYLHAIDEFVDWYCEEPRLCFSKTVVVRYRMHLESRHLAPGTINLRLGGATSCV